MTMTVIGRESVLIPFWENCMLHVVGAADWSVDPVTGRCSAEFQAPAEAHRVTVVAYGWPSDADASVVVSGIAVPVRYSRDIAISGSGIGKGVKRQIEIAARYRPLSVAWRSFEAPVSPSLFNSLLPDSFFTLSAKRRTVNVFRIEKMLEAGDLAGALGELSAAWLAGEDDTRAAAASIALRHLAANPLQRSATLGALAAALGNA